MASFATLAWFNHGRVRDTRPRRNGLRWGDKPDGFGEIMISLQNAPKEMLTISAWLLNMQLPELVELAEHELSLSRRARCPKRQNEMER